MPVAPDINDLIYQWYGGVPSIDDARYQALLAAYADGVNALMLIGAFSGLPAASAGKVLTATGDGFHATWETGGSGSAGVTVQEEGSPVGTPPSTTMNFVGAGVLATGVGAIATITISGSVKGLLSARPAAAAANQGMLWYATDTGFNYISDGATWTTASVLTTKGDLLLHNGTILVRKAVGANDLPLVADSADAAGVSYKALPIAGGGTGQITAAAALSALGGASLVDFNARTWKNYCRVASTANGTLASAFENGDTVDGVVLATGDRILLKNQTAGAENGVYTVNASGAPTRATDFDASAEIIGAMIIVTEGTVNAGLLFQNSNLTTITVGTTAITFIRRSGTKRTLFTSSGSFTPASGARMTLVRVIGGGAGGGSGASATLGAAGGGAGGGGGGVSEALLTPADITSLLVAGVVPVTVGAGGTGGPATGPSAGVSGNVTGTGPGNTFFGNSTTVGVQVLPGVTSTAATTGAGGIGRRGGNGNLNTLVMGATTGSAPSTPGGANGGFGSVGANATGTFGTIGSSVGGHGGGGGASSNAGGNGCAGGAAAASVAGGAGGAAGSVGNPGTASPDGTTPGGGGGGGGSGTTGTLAGLAGGAGGLPGGGGGGGGNGNAAAVSGAGGAGGDGAVFVVEYF